MEHDRISCYFGPFFALLSTPPPLNPENQNFEKMRKKTHKKPKPKNKIKKKQPGDIIILHHAPKIMIICYAVPDIWCETNLIFIFNLGYFLRFYPHNGPKKSKVLQNESKYQEISSLYKCVPKTMITINLVPEIWCVTDRRMDRLKK